MGMLVLSASNNNNSRSRIARNVTLQLREETCVPFINQMYYDFFSSKNYMTLVLPLEFSVKHKDLLHLVH